MVSTFLAILLPIWLPGNLVSLAQTKAAAALNDPFSKVLINLRRHQEDMKAVADLWEIQDRWGLSNSAQRKELLKALETVSGRPRAPLPVRRFAARMLAQKLVSSGDQARAKLVRQELGLLYSWWVIGPFDNEGHRGLDTVYPPEERMDLSASVLGKVRKVSWRELPASSDDGHIQLHPLMLPREAAVAYAFTILEVDRPTKVVLWIGSDDGCKVWINGTNILSDSLTHPLQDDQQAISLTLPQGSNRLLVKVAQETGNWEFSAAITDPMGRPVPGLRLVTERKAVEQALSHAMPPPPTHVLSRETFFTWFLERVPRLADDMPFLAEAALATGHPTAMSAAEQTLQKAVEGLKPRHAFRAEYLWWLSRLTSNDNLSRSLLEEAAQLAPKSPEVWSRLALQRQVRAESDKALQAFRKALDIDPQHLPSLLGEAELLTDLQLPFQASQMIDRLLQQYPDVLDVLSTAALLERRMNHLTQAEALYQTWVALETDDSTALRALFEISLQRTDINQALYWMDRLLAQDPTRSAWWIERGDLLLRNDRPEESLSAYSRATGLCPEDPAALVHEGAALMSLGRRQETLERWRLALSISPQDQNLERRIRAIQPSQEVFYQPWLVDPATWSVHEPGTATSQEQEAGAVRLLDSTVVRLHHNGMISRFRQELVRIQNIQGVRAHRTFQLEYAPGRQEVRILQKRVFHPNGSIDTSNTDEEVSLSEPWYNLFYDVRQRVVTFPALSPGDVVEFTYVIDDVGDQNLLGGYFGDLVQLQYDEPTRRSSYVLLAPNHLPLFFNQPSGMQHRVTSDSKASAGAGGTIHLWQGSDLPAMEIEPSMPGFTEQFSYLHVSTFQHWTELSRWYNNLISQQLKPGPDVVKLVDELTQGLNDPKDKIRAIYRFVADRTRYVGLEFGIHSYVPYQVDQVLQRKFGDCKDKSALLVSMFRQAGIPAQMALLRMNRLGKMATFPASLSVFNHAVCYLPDQGLWLDGTISFYDIEDLPPQDQDTVALILEDAGGRITTSPITTAERNRTEIEFEIFPEAEGGSRVRSKVVSHGNMAPEMRIQMTSRTSPKDVFEKTINELFPGAQVLSFNVTNLEQPHLPLVTSAEFFAPSLGKKNQQDLLEFPLLGRETNYQTIFAPLHDRRSDLAMSSPWSVRWSIRWTAPPGYQPAQLPDKQKLQSGFGTAYIDINQEADVTMIQGEFQLQRNRIQLKEYPDFRDFLGQVDHMFKKRLSFRRDPHVSGS